MKILISLILFVHLTSVSASLIAVMDTGTDISHSNLAPKTWFNLNEKAGSSIDLDSDGFPGDINGWDFISNSPKVFDDTNIDLITADVKTFYNYYSLYELGKLDQSSDELIWLKEHTKDNVLMNKVEFVGGYIHGTHVAGISVNNLSSAKILSMKVIPTVFEEAPPTPEKGLEEISRKNFEVPAKSVEQFTADLIESTNEQVEEMVKLHTYVAFHKADVVNQSFGIGYNDALDFIKEGFKTEVKREPTLEELEEFAKIYFGHFSKEGPKMFRVAPDTLFVIAAGNDSSDNDLYPDFPADIEAENKIVVAATFGYSSLAEFSNYGATKVEVAAPGVAINSTAPTNTFMPLSGTSQATPFVTNVIAAIKDLNPSLSVRDIKSIVLDTVDIKAWLRGRVVSSGIVNKARALKAAELAKTQNIAIAISNARSIISDVPVLGVKSLSFKPRGLDFKLKPIRPSLLIKKI